jgi:hypothetical protein
METIPELLESISDSDRRVLVSGERTYTASRFRRKVYKTTNFLRYRGIHDGSVVALADVRVPQIVFAFLAVGLLGGRVTFELDREAGTVIGPTPEIEARDFGAATTRIGFGTAPADPSVAYLEREMWSETAHVPPISVDPGRQLFADPDAWTQERAMATADNLADNLDASSVVGIRRSLCPPGTVVAGILAPLLADATILLSPGGRVGTVGVGNEPVPEPDRIEPPTRHQ